MSDKDMDFSIESILKAAQSGHSEEKKAKKPSKLPSIAENPTHKAPHALTPEEVLHFSEPQKPNKPLPDFDAISQSLNFVVFEQDIDPEKGETPQVDFGKQPPKEPTKAEAPTKAETPTKAAEPIKAEPQKPQPAAPVTPIEKAQVSPTTPSGTLYERMKQLLSEQRSTAVAPTAPVQNNPAPQKPRAEVPEKALPSEPARTAPQSENANTAEKAKPLVPQEKSAPAQGTSVGDLSLPKPTADVRPREIKMTLLTPAPRHRRVSLSVEEIIASAERTAESKIKTMYSSAPTPAATPSATAVETKVPHAKAAEVPKPVVAPAAPQSGKAAAEPKPAPKATPCDAARTPIAPPKQSTAQTNPQANTPQSTPTASAPTPRAAVKATPIKRSRVFKTPTAGGTTTPATKVVTGEIPVQVDVIDQAITAQSEDHRIKAHNPYASQYSLADADLPGQGQLFATRQFDALNGLFDNEKEIVSSAAATANTIRFDAIQDPDAAQQADVTADPREAWEDEFEASRRTEVEKFKLFGDNEAENAPEELPGESEPAAAASDLQPGELNDYETVDDAPSVLAYLKGKLAHISLRLIATVLITALLFILATPLCAPVRAANAVLYGVVNLLLLLLAATVNLPTMKGLISLVKLRPDTDSPAALAVCGALVQGVFVCVSAGNGVFLTALGGLALTFNLIGKRLTLSAIKANFRMIADEDDKKSVVLIDDAQAATPISCGSVLGEAVIVAGRKIKNATAFLFNSFAPDPYEKPLGKIMLFTLLAAVGGGVYGFVLQGAQLALTLFSALLALGCPITTALLSALPMRLAAKRLNRLGAELTGFAAAREMGYANALALEANDLFPKGTVNLYNMHILAPNPIDRSILEAAAIASRANSPLAPIFTGMNQENAPLPEVDTIKFEDKMGLSGWIGEKRIFIGNRTLMTAHNVSGLPSLDIDKRILKSGYFPIYLATTEGPCALFIVGYEADEEISNQLRRLTDEGVTLLVSSCDQNLSEEMICDYFELYPDLVKVLPGHVTPLYQQQVVPAVSEPSFAVCKSDAAGMAALVTASLRINRVYHISLVLHCILLILGFTLVFGAVYSGLAASLTAITLGIYQLVSGLLTLAVPLLYRP